MVREFIDTLLEEYLEAENMEEVEMLTSTNVERGMMTDELKAAHAAAEARIKGTAQGDALDLLLASFTQPAATQARPAIDPIVQKVAELEALIASLKGQPLAIPTPAQATAPVIPQRRVSKKYRLLKTDVSWTSIPQVHAVMAILVAHVDVGDVVEESEIVKMMVANEATLATRQGGKRIWDYYKGSTGNGLIAHGNIEVVA